MISGGERKVIVEELAELLGKGRSELWTSVRDDFVVKSKMKVDFVEEEGGYSFSGDCFLSWAENYPLHKAMVDHDQQEIKAGGSGEVSDQVTRDLLEGARGMRSDQSERGNSGMCI